ncbi:MAG: hypothetical protein AAFP70_20485 [Calditrichota bacterium]
MTRLLIKLLMLIFFISLASGAQLEMPLEENFIRAATIYFVFSVLILLMYFISNQSSVNILKAQLERENNSFSE